MVRVAGRDIEFCGKSIKKGDGCIVHIEKANKYAPHIKNPDTLDIFR
jgi:hypothetical protein